MDTKKKKVRSPRRPSMLRDVKDRRRRVIKKLEEDLKILVVTNPTEVAYEKRVKKELAVLKTRV